MVCSGPGKSLLWPWRQHHQNASPTKAEPWCSTITAPIDYEGILKMEGASALPLASTFKCWFLPDNVVVQITEPMAGAASCQGLKEGKPPALLARRATAVAAATAPAAARRLRGQAGTGARGPGGGGGWRETIKPWMNTHYCAWTWVQTSGSGKICSFRAGQPGGCSRKRIIGSTYMQVYPGI